MMNEKKFTDDRRGAWKFFQGLERYLRQEIPSPTRVREKVAESVTPSRASVDKREGWEKKSESAFLNEYIFRLIHEFVSAWDHMSDETARAALLVEGYRHNHKFASGSPRRSMEHPFTKVPCDPDSIMDRWKKRGRL